MKHKLSLENLQNYPIGENGLKFLHKRLDNEPEPLYIMEGLMLDEEIEQGYDIFARCQSCSEGQRIFYSTPKIIIDGFNNWYKPILRPISQLNKEIVHENYNDNKPFIPIIELAKIAFPDHEWFITESGVESHTGMWFWYNHESHSFGVDGTITNHVPNQLKIFKFLFKLHFDVYDLIDKELAVDYDNILAG